MSCRLAAHWKLDVSPYDNVTGNIGLDNNVDYIKTPPGVTAGAASFNGLDSRIEIPEHSVPHFGNGDFSIALWVKPESPMTGVFGDLISKFDSANRRGINLYVAGSSPAYCGMSDTRHVHFGIDDGYTGSWDDLGKPVATNSLVPNLVVFEGSLYCGTADAADPNDAAHVFRWDGGDGWIDCGRLGNDLNHLSTMSMIVHAGELYAGTGIWDWDRAKGRIKELPAASPTRLFVYEGGIAWRDLGRVGCGSRMLCMTSYKDCLYMGLDSEGGGACFRYDATDGSISECGAPDENTNLECLLAYGGTLYAATHGCFFKYLGGRDWQRIGDYPHNIDQVHSLQVAGGRLYAGTWPQGYVLRYEGGSDWSVAGRLGLPPGSHEPCNEVMDLVVHNGKLYAALIPLAEIYRYESDGNWTCMKSLASRPDWSAEDGFTWCRVTSLATHGGRLLASTGSCHGRSEDSACSDTLGRIYAAQTGVLASWEHDIGFDWTHLAAVRKGRILTLHVNGETVSTETPPNHEFNLDSGTPLLVGCGAQGSFSGLIADLRIYEGALSPRHITELQEEVS